MSRRSLLKLMGLLPLLGPSLAHALTKCASGLRRRVYGPYLPSSFPKWDRAHDGLESAAQWALDLERSQLPSDRILPRAGQIWEAVHDCEVPFRAATPFRPWRGPQGFTLTPAQLEKLQKIRGLGVARIRQGEKVRILGGDNPKPIHVVFVPLRYEELHAAIVEEEIRKLPGYGGYNLYLKTAKTDADFVNKDSRTYFTESFRLVENSA